MKRQWWPVIKSPAVLIFLVSSFLLALNVLLIGHWRPFNSDDLYWQNVVRNWQPFSGDTLYLATKDIFLVQVPFFALVENIFNPSRRLVLAEGLILTLGSFALFYWSIIYFLRQLRSRPTYLTLLPMVWLASFGFPLVQNYLNTNWRTSEIGLSFVTIALAAAITFNQINPLKSVKMKIFSGLVLVFIGLVIYSDPYYIYFTLGPLLLFTLFLFVAGKITRRHLGIIFGGTFLSLILAKLWSLLATKAGIIIVGDTPSVFVSFDNILTNIISSLHGLLIVFGADFFGRPAFGLTTFGMMINAALLVFILYRAYRLRYILSDSKVRAIPLPRLWPTFFSLVVFFVLFVYTLTTLVAINNYRFFIILVYAAVAFLVMLLALTPKKSLRLAIAALLVGGTLFNSALTFLTNDVRNYPEVASNVNNGVNYRILDAVRSEGLSKGYAGYWQGNVNTYLSQNKIAFLPSLCDEKGETVRFNWLLNNDLFNKPANRSFYVFDPNFPAPGVCTVKQLSKQFGTPQRIIKIDNRQILIYNYDISSKISSHLPAY